MPKEPAMKPISRKKRARSRMKFQNPVDAGRRDFFAKVGTAAAVLASGAAGLESAAAAQSSASKNFGADALPQGVTNRRVTQAFRLRVSEAVQDAQVPAAGNVSNGDEALYPDKGGTFTKSLPHDSFGRVDLNAFASFKAALTSGKFSDFENMVMGGTRTMNGPQGGLAFDLEALDNAQFGQPQVPPAPKTAGNQNATELLEHYWASLLRDVAFTDYGSSALAAQGAGGTCG